MIAILTLLLGALGGFLVAVGFAGKALVDLETELEAAKEQINEYRLDAAIRKAVE